MYVYVFGRRPYFARRIGVLVVQDVVPRTYLFTIRLQPPAASAKLSATIPMAISTSQNSLIISCTFHQPAVLRAEVPVPSSEGCLTTLGWIIIQGA